MKRFGVFVFWFLMAFLVFYVFLSIVLANTSTEEKEEIAIEKSKITSHEAVDFGKDFLYKFYNVNSEDEEDDRRAILEDYVSSNVDTDILISNSNIEKISLTKDEIITKEIDEINENNARITYLIHLSIVEIFEEDTKDEELEEEQDEKMIFVGDKLIRQVPLYVSVPIELINDNTFVIKNEPSFLSYIEEEKENVTNLLSELKELDDYDVEKKARGFLNTFFESFSEDNIDRLSYLLEDEKFSGLSETLKFKDVKNVSFYEGKNDKEFVADVDVIYIEPYSEMEMSANYLLVVMQVDDRLVVKHINNDIYINEIINSPEDNEENDDD